ncbi:MAG: PDDEXK nuclease domain-containing protein [Acidobacteriota bacterium]
MASRENEIGNSDEVLERVDTLLADIRNLILSARRAAVRSVDILQVLTCFEIGRRIVEHEQQGLVRAEYGQHILRELAERLIAEFGKGFSKSNLEYMRRFYSMYRSRSTSIPQTLSGQSGAGKKRRTPSGESGMAPAAQGVLIPGKPSFPLSWSHYVFLMGIGDPKERAFYELEASSCGWSLRELKRQFSSSLYERLALSRDKAEIRRLAKEGQVITGPQDLLKEPYVLEFLGLDEKSGYSESDLESAIIDRLEHFLLELGKGFLFEARQKRFTFDEDHFYVDLVFYNRLLRCYVLIDLKIGKLTHQDLGQMQMYANYFDRHVKTEDEHPTVGIILCKKKHDALVEITLPKDAHIHAKEYQLYLPSKEDLRRKLLEWVEEQEARA